MTVEDGRVGDRMTRVTFTWASGTLSDVPVPRVPAVDERVIGPDDFGKFTVASVTYEYAGGFAFEPTAVVVALVGVTA